MVKMDEAAKKNFETAHDHHSQVLFRKFDPISEAKPASEAGLREMDEIDKMVVDVIAEVLIDVNKEHISLDSKIVEDLGAESLDIYDMVALLEDRFGIQIADEQMEKIVTVSDASNFIKATGKTS
jgi:acyl carrier protein